MSTHRRTRRRAEERAARLFGTKRQPCSGSSGRPDVARSDSTRPSLFIETKPRQSSTARSLLDATRKPARKEGKTAVLCPADKSRPGLLVCRHSDDLEALVVACRAARASDELMGKIRVAFDRLRGFDEEGGGRES